jgi:Ca-activated chloride channel family protein
MRFESPLMLWLLIPAIAAIIYGIWKLNRNPAHLNVPTIKHAVAAGQGLRSRLVYLPAVLQALGIILAILTLARPQIEEQEELSGEGVDFVIALDMSGSMNAVDMPADRILSYHAKGLEPPNRFESAREILKKFIISRDHDRLGLVIFSSKAYVKFPLTLDKDTMIEILDGLVLDNRLRNENGECVNGCTIKGESTAIGDSLARSFKRLEDSKTKSRNIILITDGDNNAGKAAPDEVAEFIAKESASNPIRVFSFLVGNGGETYLPAIHAMTGQVLKTNDGLQVYEPSKDEMPVKPQLLKDISDKTQGRFYQAPSEQDFRKEFADLEKTEFASPALHNWREAFVAPLIAAFVIFLIGLLLGMTVLRRWP